MVVCARQGWYLLSSTTRLGSFLQRPALVNLIDVVISLTTLWDMYYSWRFLYLEIRNPRGLDTPIREMFEVCSGLWRPGTLPGFPDAGEFILVVEELLPLYLETLTGSELPGLLSGPGAAWVPFRVEIVALSLYAIVWVIVNREWHLENIVVLRLAYVIVLLLKLMMICRELFAAAFLLSIRFRFVPLLAHILLVVLGFAYHCSREEGDMRREEEAGRD